MRGVTVALLALLALVQASLWFGRGGVPYTLRLRSQLQQQQAENAASRERNRRLRAEIDDLKEGLEMVEERARMELGMVRPDEILVQIVAPAGARR
jgi:cell division protein FtsB